MSKPPAAPSAHQLLGALADRDDTFPAGSPDFMNGTVVSRWLDSISTDGVLPACGHPGVLYLNVEDPEPCARCRRCAAERPDVPDDGICRLCSRPSREFRAFHLGGEDDRGAETSLIISGYACTRCLGDDNSFARISIREQVTGLTAGRIAQGLARMGGRATRIVQRGIAQETSGMTDEEWQQADAVATACLPGLPPTE